MTSSIRASVSTLAVAATATASLFVVADAASAYTCNSDADNPTNVTVGLEEKVAAHGNADCPDDTQWKELKVTLVRDISWAPDQNVTHAYDTGRQRRYTADAVGCGYDGTKGYKSVTDFEGHQNSSAVVDLTCEK